LDLLITIIVFLVIFSILILVHEWGHFTMARRADIKIEEFGIGLPPRALVLKKAKETLYSLNWIPFGGFVRMLGEDATDRRALKDPRSFINKTIGQRTKVIVAGVVMNFLLGILLLTICFGVGVEPFVLTQADFERELERGNIITAPGVYVNEVLEDSPAEQAGIQAGDVILEVEGQKVERGAAVVEITKANTGEEISYLLLRGEEEVEISAKVSEEGRVGVSIADIPVIQEIKKVKYPWYQAPFVATREAGKLSVATARMFGGVLKNLVSRFEISDNVAGPLGIAQMTYGVTKKGVIAVFKFVALLSISLGTINFLPLPALDGGRFLFIVVEVIRRKKANAQWETAIHGTGFILLMLLIFAITYKDILRIFSGG